MNLTILIKQYFHSSSNDVTIDVFDEKKHLLCLPTSSKCFDAIY